MLARQVEDERGVLSDWLLSPHPSPLPLGEGASFAASVPDRGAWNGRSAERAKGAVESPERVESRSLSLPPSRRARAPLRRDGGRERVRVRGNPRNSDPAQLSAPGTVDLRESSGRAKSLPGRL